MEMAMTLFMQIIKMFMMMSVGYAVYKLKWINEEGTKGLSIILLKVVTPCIVFNSFLIKVDYETVKQMLICLALSLVATLVGILLANATFKKKERINRFSVAFSNVGFMGIPLVQALLGSEWILYLSIYIAVFNVSLWTYGVYLMSKDKSEVTVSKIMWNPNVLSVILGILWMTTQLSFPTMLQDVVASFAGINTPLAMTVLGVYIAKEDLLSIFNQAEIYKVVAVRLILTPLVVIGLFFFIPETYASIKLVVLIAAATPTASSCAMLAQLYRQNYAYAAQVVSLTTILCLFTMPIMISLSSMIW